MKLSDHQAAQSCSNDETLDRLTERLSGNPNTVETKRRDAAALLTVLEQKNANDHGEVTLKEDDVFHFRDVLRRLAHR